MDLIADSPEARPPAPCVDLAIGADRSIVSGVIGGGIAAMDP
jgi:hypothetical protein